MTTLIGRPVYLGPYTSGVSLLNTLLWKPHESLICIGFLQLPAAKQISLKQDLVLLDQNRALLSVCTEQLPPGPLAQTTYLQ